MPTVYSPETDAELLSRHAVTDIAERRTWMKQLARQAEPIALHCDALGLCGFASQLRWDESNATLELLAQPEPGLLTGAEIRCTEPLHATAVALIEGVKLQFDIAARACAPTAHATDGHWRLHAAMPEVIHRLQRRDAFRVVPSAMAPAELWLLTPGERARERSVQIADVSATGIAFRWPKQAGPAPATGSRLIDCRLELSGTIPIDCTLIVTESGTEPTTDSSDARVRVGSRFEGLSPSAARAVQVYVNLAQVRARARRPQIDSNASVLQTTGSHT
jgi:hypothetical protein